MVEAAYLTRLEEVRIGKSAIEGEYAILVGVKAISITDSDPWYMLEIPQGNIIWQHLKPPHMLIKLTCLDFASFQQCFYETDVHGTQHAIDQVSGDKNLIDYFIIKALDHNGASHTFTFSGAKVKEINVELQEQTDNSPVVEIYADTLVIS